MIHSKRKIFIFLISFFLFFQTISPALADAYSYSGEGTCQEHFEKDCKNLGYSGCQDYPSAGKTVKATYVCAYLSSPPPATGSGCTIDQYGIKTCTKTIPTPTNTPAPTATPACILIPNYDDPLNKCNNCESMTLASINSCTGSTSYKKDEHYSNCQYSPACVIKPAPTAEGSTPTAAPGAPTAAVRVPTAAAGRPAQSIDTTCEGTLEMVVNGDTCEYKSSWKMSAPEGDGKCEVWLRSAVSGELTQMVDGNGAPVTDCNAQAESSDFKLNSGEDFDLVISNGKSECSNKVVASKKCEASAASEPSSGDEQPPVEAPAPVVGPAIGDSKCTDAGFALDGEEYGQCGGDMHNTCDEASDGRADDNEELVVKRFKNEDGELRYLTQNRGKTPGVCGNPVSTPRPARSPTAGGNGGKPGSRSSGNAACKIGSQSPRVSDTCAQCIGMAQHVKPMDPGKFNVCSDTQVTNYWCNGGVSEGAKNDCTEAKQKRCLAQCVGPTAAKQPTNTPAPGAPTETSTPAASGELPEDIKKLDGAEPIGCLSLADIIKIENAVTAGTKTRAEANELYSINRLTDPTTGNYLCEKQRKNP